MFVQHNTADRFVSSFSDNSIDAVITDPPYFGIVDESWDTQWKHHLEYSRWLVSILQAFHPKLRDNGSLIVFSGIGSHGVHPLFSVVCGLESCYAFRNWVTWKKRRAYGKSHDYLFCREEILWFSKSHERTGVTFNIPLTHEKRGYAGFNQKYPAKSEYKRVSNVWDDIPELMRPTRQCEKPIPLLERLVKTHTNPGELVVDPFAGTGTTGVAALSHGRWFLGCDADSSVINTADSRCREAYMVRWPSMTDSSRFAVNLAIHLGVRIALSNGGKLAPEALAEEMTDAGALDGLPAAEVLEWARLRGPWRTGTDGRLELFPCIVAADFPRPSK